MELRLFGTLLLAVVLSIVLYIFTWRRNIRRRNMPPGPAPLPILGTMLHVNNNEMPQSLIRLSETYGSVFTIYLSNTPAVVLIGYDCVKEALVDNGDIFNMRGPSEIGDLLFKGFGVILTNDERSRQLRTFSLSIMRHFVTGTKSIEGRVQEEARYLTEEIRKTGGTPFDPTNLLNMAVFNVICSVVFGDRFEYEDVQFKTLFGLLRDTSLLMATPWGMLLNLFPKTLSLISGPHQLIFRNLERLKAIIAESYENHKATFDPNSLRDFIDCFLMKMEEEKDDPITEFHFDNLSGTIIDLFFAGTETTSTTLKYGFLYLLKYPFAERKIHVEIDRVIGQNPCPSEEHRVQMPYTDAVVHEMQRFADITPMGLSHATTQDTMFRGYHIPKGTIIFPVLTSVLKDPKYFKNPTQFEPTNFLNANGSFRRNDAFVPFSLGSRSCIGENLARMELFLFLTNILKDFNLKSVLDPEDIEIAPEPNRTIAMPRTYQMYVTPR